MSAMLRHERSVALFAAILPFVFLSIPLRADGQDVQQYLRDQYQGKTFILRGFYSGRSLHFDSTGNLREAPIAGDWTTDGVVQISDIGVSGDRLIIRAGRLHWGWLRGEGMTTLHDQAAKDKQDRDEKKDRNLQIEADLGPGAKADEADAAFSRIFLTPQDSFADLVPEYWSRCIRAALGEGNWPNMNGCRLSSDFLAIPGVAHPSDSPVSDQQETPKIQHFGPRISQPEEKNGVFHPGRGITPPRAVSNPNPEFTEEARRAKMQGVVVLSLIVDKDGAPTHVYITNPLGCGLDARAVQTVQSWTFKPGLKDGEPVPVEIAVETDFHLY
jgi:TonB family protein